MTIQATDVYNSDNRIDVATIIGVTWGDDTPSFFAVRIEEVAAYRQAFRPARVDILSEREASNANWIGIKVASDGHVAAWGRAVIEIH